MAGPRDTGLTQLPVVDGRRVGSFQDAFLGTSSQPATTPTVPIHHLVADLSAHAPMMVAHLTPRRSLPCGWRTASAASSRSSR